jgi:hypothetical protein
VIPSHGGSKLSTSIFTTPASARASARTGPPKRSINLGTSMLSNCILPHQWLGLQGKSPAQEPEGGPRRPYRGKRGFGSGGFRSSAITLSVFCRRT